MSAIKKELERLAEKTTPRTAGRHRENLMHKLGARSLADLVWIAVRAGICRD